MPATERCRHVAQSALDPGWLDAVEPARGVFVTAQGLFMYFDEVEVKRLFTAIMDRFAGVEIMFDAIPRWFSKKTLDGFGKTRHYTAPPMPWGVNHSEIEPLLRDWSDAVATVTVRPYGYVRGLPGLALRTLFRVPGLRNIPPTIVYVRAHGMLV